MMRRLMLSGLAAGLVLSGAACHLCKKYKGRDCCPSAGPYLGDPVPRGGTIPPTSVPTTPPSPMPGEPLPPPVLPDTRGSFSIDPRTPPGPWDPTPTRPSQPELLTPEPLPRGVSPEVPLSSKSDASGFLGEPVRPVGGTDLPPKPADRMLSGPTARAPVGLPGYARVAGRDGVATGRRPGLDGFDWLKSNGFKTVVYLHAPSADVAAVRDLTAARGLRFVPIAVSPGTLPKAFAEFAAAVEDRGGRPLYVIDETGTRAGSLWYLLFRTRDLLGDDTARLRAAPLGLTEATTEEQKQFWIAVQDYLAKR
ncbi:MAG TPA: hypothetical protein VFG68_01980 [Fimbriiglobus sp.]|nr:hypothetical protein [Fimbriiglobus sp.]